MRLADGRELQADAVVAATGVMPHVEFLDGSGVGTGWGVTVDAHLATSVPGIFAAGDVAESADWLTGERYVHAIFPNAVAQGRITAANALGAGIGYDGAESMNSLKHLGVPVVAMGTTEGADEVLRSDERGCLRSVYLREGHVVGAQLAGGIAGAGVYHSLMLRRAGVRRLRHQLVAPGFGTASVVWSALDARASARGC